MIKQSQRNFIPKKLEIPFFISKKIRQRNENERLIKHVLQHKTIYKCNENLKEEIEDNNLNNVTSKVRRLKIDRSLIKPKSWQLPPNRYNPKINPIKLEGNKGSFWPKIDTKKPHRMGTQVNDAIYDITSNDMSKRPAKYKYMINRGSDIRNKKPTSRFMIRDHSSCWRDPSFPAPNKYSTALPVCVKKKPASEILNRKPLIYRFYKNSYIPITDLSIHDNRSSNSMTPSPNLYHPVHCIRQPNLNKTDSKWKSYSKTKIDKEMYKIKKFRNESVTKFLPIENLDSHNIKGHGHTYLFKQKYRNPKKMPTHHINIDASTKNMDAGAKLFRYRQQLIRIINQKRKLMTFRIPAKPEKSSISIIRPPKSNMSNMRFTSLSKPIDRKKSKEVKHLAFMSCLPRWSGADAMQPILTKSEINYTLPKHPKLKFDNVTSKIYNQPVIYKKSLTLQLQFKFSEIPPEKLLHFDEDSYKYEKNTFKCHITDINDRDFYRDEYL